MLKKGQVTTFIIVGLIVLIAFIFIFFLRDQFVEKLRNNSDNQAYLTSQLDIIKKEVIDKCIEQETTNALRAFGEQGGNFEPLYYTTLYSKKVNFLCLNIPDQKTCLNQGFNQVKAGNILNNYVSDAVYNCINLNDFENKGYDISTGDFDLNLKINLMDVLIKVDYPITLTRNEESVKRTEFSKLFYIPLGKFIEITNNILVDETTKGEFDIALFFSPYVVRWEHSYPHRVYIIETVDKTYKFQFAVESEP